MGTVIDLTKTVTFQGGIRVGYVDNDSSETSFGLIRYNTTRNRFEGLHKTAGAGPGGSNDADMSSNWRELTTDIASATKLGGIKIGTNLTINPVTGVASSVATGESRINQQVITVSDNVGAADYQSISTAISHALGTSPGYADGATTTTYGAPSLTNQYIIVVSPGEYTDKINLPNYVTLMGEGTGKTFLKLATGGSNQANGALVSMAANSALQNITLNLDANGQDYAVGAYASSNNSITLRNVEIVDTGTSSTNSTYGVYLSSGTGHTLENVEATLDKGTGSVYGGYFTGTSPIVENSKFTITSGSSNNYGLYLNSIRGAETDVVNSKIVISGAANNYGVYHNDADSNIRFCKIKVDGDTDNSTDTGYGIVGNSSSASATITNTDIEFIHHETAKDVIFWNNASDPNDFVAQNYKVGMTIKVSGASNSTNNNYFTITQITTDTLTLSEGDVLVNEAAGQSITVKQLYTIDVDYSYVQATSNSSSVSNSVAVLSSSGNFAVTTNSSRLLGGVPFANSSKFNLRQERIIYVATRGGDYHLLSEALAAINDADSERRYMIKIQPGNYVETAQIILKQYVNIEGCGAENTIINFDVAHATEANAAAVVLNSNVNISGITVKNTTASATTKSIGFYGSSKSDITINNCKLEITGTARTKYGMYLSSCNYQSHQNEVVVTAGASSNNNYGIYHTGCTVINETSQLTISGISDTLNAAIVNQDTNLLLLTPKISVGGSTTSNKGVTGTSSGATDYIIQVFNGEILVSDTGNKSLVLEDDNYTLIATGVRLDGDVSYTESNTDTNLKCVNCYKITGGASLTYTPLNFRGLDEQGSQNLTIGDGSGKQGSSGTGNTITGINSGLAMTSGSRNVFTGVNTGKANTIGDDNTFIGASAGIKNNAGDYNTFVGSNAGIRMVSGVSNTFLGRSAGYFSTGNYNVAVGDSAGYSLSSGADNVMVGQGSGFNTQAGSQNVMIGGGSSGNVGAGYQNTSGKENTYVGYQSGKSATTSDDNTAVGWKAGFTNTAADNTFLGSEAGLNVSTGTENVVVGRAAGKGDASGATGNYNVVVGSNAAISLTSGGHNVVMGKSAGNSLTTGLRNVFIGSTSNVGGTDAAGYANQSGVDNIIIGSKAGKLATVSNNIIMGSNAGSSITTGTPNLLLGVDSGATNQTGSNNLFLGHRTGFGYKGSDSIMIGNFAGENSTNNKSTFIGINAGQNIKGDYNTYIGYGAGKSRPDGNVGTGGNNVAIGAFVAYKIKGGARNIVIGSGDSATDGAAVNLEDGNDNIIMGSKSGKALTDGNNNIAIGGEAGRTMTTAAGNLMMGYQSGRLATGSYNVMVGHQSGYSQTSSDKNVFLGYQAGYTNTNGNNLIAIGNQAGFSGSSAVKNISIGDSAGYNTTGNNNLNIGFEAGKSNTTGDNNMFIGYQTGADSTGSHTGSFNMFIGNQAGYKTEGGSRNMFIGNQAGTNNVSGAKNIFMGNYAGHLGTTTSQNIFIGTTDSDSHGVGHVNTGNHNIAIGSNVAISNTSGERNISIGREAGEANTTGDQNINVGYRSGEAVNTGSNNINIGTNTGRYNESGQRNIYLGHEAGSDSVLGTALNDNIMIGYQAGNKAQVSELIMIGKEAGLLNTTGANNIFIGPEAGKNNETAGNNIFIGANAGKANTDATATDNIFIGTDAGLANTSGKNNVVIGNQAFNVGTSANDVVIIGFECGQNSTVDDSILIGSQAGKALSTGPENIMIGRKAGTATETGPGNIFLGAEAGLTNVIGAYNIGIGYQALKTFKNNSGSGDKGFNIALGYQSALNMGKSTGLGSSSEPFQNTIIGYQSLYEGDINKNNVIIGTSAAYKANNPINFENNIMIGSSVGKTSNLAVNSVVVGPNAMETGTGGESNIIMGRQAGQVVGNNLEYSAILQTTTAVNDNSIIIDLEFGSGSYYFKSGDTINIDSGTQTSGNYTISQVEANDNSLYTKLYLTSAMTTVYNSGSNVYVTTKTSTNIGKSDTSKGSSNTIMGNQSAQGNTTGSKNIAIGDQAMKNNKIGKYNNVLGTNAGYNLISDNNTCFGTRAGYSLDSYDTGLKFTGTDYKFYTSNNSIVTDSDNFNNTNFGTVIDISGTSSNDGRYNVLSSNVSNIKLEGFPSIKQDGIPKIINNDNFKIDNNSFSTINCSYTGNSDNTLAFGTFTVTQTYNYDGTPVTYDSNVSGFRIKTTHGSIFEKSNLFKISGSKFNDGIYFFSYYLIDGIYHYYFNYSTNNLVSYEEVNGYDVTITTNEIRIADKNTYLTSSANAFQKIMPNQIAYNFFSENRKLLRSDKDSNPLPKYTENLYANSLFVTDTVSTEENFTDIIFTEGKEYSSGITNTSYLVIVGNNTIFNPTTQTITINGVNSTAITTGYIQITGTSSNNNILKINSITTISSSKIVILYIDDNTPLTSETIDTGFNVEQIEMGGLIGINNIVTKNNIVNLSVTDSSSKPIKYINGSYIVNIVDESKLSLLDSIYLQQININDLVINKEIYNISSNVGVFQGESIFFQKTTITDTMTLTFSNKTIASPTTFKFAEIVPPVMIHLSGATNSDNDKYYLVIKNEYPYNLLHLSPHSTLTGVGADSTTFTIKTNSISHRGQTTDFSDIRKDELYTIFGAKQNHLNEIKVVNDALAVSNVSVYCNNDTSVINDYEASIGIAFINKNMNDSEFNYQNYGYFNRISGTDGVTFYNSTSMAIIVTSDSDQIELLDKLQDHDYISFTNSVSNNKTFFIRKIIKSTGPPYTYSITLDGNTVTDSPGSPSEESNVNFLVNEFRTDNSDFFAQTSNIDLYKLQETLGNNSKFLSFSRILEGSQYDGFYHAGKSLTFEVDKTVDNLSNVAVSLIDACPQKLIGDGYTGGNVFPYIIEMGQPSVSGGSIYRRPKGICESRNLDIQLSNHTGNLEFHSANNTIKITNTNPISSESGIAFSSVGGAYNKPTDFGYLKRGQSIRFERHFNFVGLFNNEHMNFIVEEISPDKTSITVNKIRASDSMITETITGSNFKSVILKSDEIYSDAFNFTFDSSNFRINSDISMYIYHRPAAFYMVGYTPNFLLSSNIDITSSIIDTSNCTSNNLIFTNNYYGQTYYANNNHTMIINNSNISTDIFTNISFQNTYAKGDFTFNSSANTITCSNLKLGDAQTATTFENLFGQSQYVLIENGNANKNKRYLTHPSTGGTATTLTLADSEGTAWTDETLNDVTIITNTINSNSSVNADLSTFKPGQTIIIGHAQNNNNNRSFQISSSNITTSTSLFIEPGATSNVTTESSKYCTITKSVLIDETSKITGAANIDFSNSNKKITVSSGATKLNNFRPGQSINVTGTSSNNTNFTIDDVVPTDDTIVITTAPTDESSTTPTIAKNVEIRKIGKPISTTTTGSWYGESNTVNFHYQEAQGNNLMLGSFAGQFTGSKSLAIHNVHIGSKVGQCNHGSGNIFLGNETQLAEDGDIGSTTYNNKFAIYKSNFVGVPNEPLIGGDFGSQKIGIGTIVPDSYSGYTNITNTKTKLVINGGAIANSYSPFTGTHKVRIKGDTKLEPGSIVVTTGISEKQDLLNSIVTVESSTLPYQKTVYGVYSHTEYVIEGDNTNLYIQDENGNIIENSNLSDKKIPVHYCASVGEGCILVSNVNGNVLNGDYITTSNIAGYGMKQDDDILHSYTVAKCTESVDWSNISSQVHNSNSIVSCLVSCTYHCG